MTLKNGIKNNIKNDIKNDIEKSPPKMGFKKVYLQGLNLCKLSLSQFSWATAYV